MCVNIIWNFLNTKTRSLKGARRLQTKAESVYSPLFCLNYGAYFFSSFVNHTQGFIITADVGVKQLIIVNL